MRTKMEIRRSQPMSCPSWGSGATQPLTRRTGNGKDYHPTRCSACGQHYTDPLPSPAEIAAFYQGTIMLTFANQGARRKTSEPSSSISGLGASVRQGRPQPGHRHRTVSEPVEEGGFDAAGLEFNPLSAAWGREHYGVEIRTSSLEEAGLPLESYDLISMTDVLEHMRHPLQYLRLVRSYLKPGGIAPITFPDLTSVESR